MFLDDFARRAVQILPKDVQDRFALDPLGVLRTSLRMKVTAVDHLARNRTDGGACDGLSFLEDGVILYAPSPHSRRQNFTLAHELGHWLADQTPGVYDWLADQRDAGKLLETLCDRIAQTLLMPPEKAKEAVKVGPIRAQHVLDLYNSTLASRPVCAIALSKHLPGLGAIVIIDQNSSSVSHASINPDPESGWPTVFPWRGQRLAPSHPLSMLPSGSTLTRRLTWPTPWGAQADFYVDAIAEKNRVIAVFSTHDHWGSEKFHPETRRDFDSRPLLNGYCCGAPFERRGFPCGACRGPYCPDCGDCECDRSAKRQEMCSNCFLQFPRHLVVDGVCADCRY